MTKRDIAKRIADQTGVSAVAAQDVVQQVLDGIIEILVQEGRVELRNFGVMTVKERKARQGRNPRTGEIVNVPRRFGVAFRPGREMQVRVQQLKEVPEVLGPGIDLVDMMARPEKAYQKKPPKKG